MISWRYLRAVQGRHHLRRRNSSLTSSTKNTSYSSDAVTIRDARFLTQLRLQLLSVIASRQTIEDVTDAVRLIVKETGAATLECFRLLHVGG